MQILIDSPLPAVWSLICYCQNSRLCDGDTDICQGPQAVCFVRIHIHTVNANPVYEYGCQEFANDHFNDRMEACLEGPIVNDFVSTQCCNETGCNEYLNPPLPLAFRTTIPVQDPTTSTAPSLGTGIKT